MADTPYQSAAAIRAAVTDLEDEGLFPDALIQSLVAEFEEVAEEYRGVAFTTRSVTAEYHVCIGGPVRLYHPKLRSVSSVAVTYSPAGSATALVSSQYTVDNENGIVVYGFPSGATTAVSYVHGFDSPPNVIIRACRQYVRACAKSDVSGVSRDVVAQSSDGFYTRYSTPDRSMGRPTGYVEVDRLLNSAPQYRTPLVA